MSKIQAIIMKPADNVCTLVVEGEPGTKVAVNIAGAQETFTIVEKIPFGHKFAVSDIPKGGEIRKYGEIIGVATKDIGIGQHVHVHNLESCRGRGDK